MAIGKAEIMIEQRAVQKVAGPQTVIPVAQRGRPRQEPSGSALPGPEQPGRGALRETASVRETDDWITGEPSVQDLLRDPLIHAVLQRDGLGLQDLLQAIALGRSRLTAPAAASDAA